MGKHKLMRARSKGIFFVLIFQLVLFFVGI